MDNQLQSELNSWLTQFATERRRQLIDEILDQRTRHITVVLENIYQPHNASAVLRSCEIFGVQDVHIIEDVYEYTLNPEVAMGASKWLTLHRYGAPDPLPHPGMRGTKAQAAERKALPSSTPDCLKELKSQGYTVVATSLRPGAVSLYDLPIDKPIALCFGTEETGLSEAAHGEADIFMTIPMVGFTQSFNISVSAALTLQTLTHELRRSAVDWQIPAEQRPEILTKWLIQSTRRGNALARQFFRDRRLPIPEAFEEVEEEEAET